RCSTCWARRHRIESKRGVGESRCRQFNPGVDKSVDGSDHRSTRQLSTRGLGLTIRLHCTERDRGAAQAHHRLPVTYGVSLIDSREMRTKDSTVRRNASPPDGRRTEKYARPLAGTLT